MVAVLVGLVVLAVPVMAGFIGAERQLLTCLLVNSLQNGRIGVGGAGGAGGGGGGGRRCWRCWSGWWYWPCRYWPGFRREEWC